MELNKLSLALLTATTIGLTACGGDSDSSGSNAIDLDLTATDAVTDVTITTANEGDLLSADNRMQIALNQRVSGSVNNLTTLAQVMASNSTTTADSEDDYRFTATEAGTYVIYLTGSRADGSTPEGAAFTVTSSRGAYPLANGGYFLTYDLTAGQSLYFTVRDLYYYGGQTTTNYEVIVAEMSREALGLADGEHLLRLNGNTAESCSGEDNGTPWTGEDELGTSEEFALFDLNSAMLYLAEYDFPGARVRNASITGFTADWEGTTTDTDSEGTYSIVSIEGNSGSFAMTFNNDLSGGDFTGNSVETYETTETNDGTVVEESTSECETEYVSGTFTILL